LAARATGSSSSSRRVRIRSRYVRVFWSGKKFARSKIIADARLRKFHVFFITVEHDAPLIIRYIMRARVCSQISNRNPRSRSDQFFDVTSRNYLRVVRNLKLSYIGTSVLCQYSLLCKFFYIEYMCVVRVPREYIFTNRSNKTPPHSFWSWRRNTYGRSCSFFSNFCVTVRFIRPCYPSDSALLWFVFRLRINKLSRTIYRFVYKDTVVLRTRPPFVGHERRTTSFNVAGT